MQWLIIQNSYSYQINQYRRQEPTFFVSLQLLSFFSGSPDRANYWWHFSDPDLQYQSWKISAAKTLKFLSSKRFKLLESVKLFRLQPTNESIHLSKPEVFLSSHSLLVRHFGSHGSGSSITNLCSSESGHCSHSRNKRDLKNGLGMSSLVSSCPLLSSLSVLHWKICWFMPEKETPFNKWQNQSFQKNLRMNKRNYSLPAKVL